MDLCLKRQVSFILQKPLLKYLHLTSFCLSSFASSIFSFNSIGLLSSCVIMFSNLVSISLSILSIFASKFLLDIELSYLVFLITVMSSEFLTSISSIMDWLLKMS